MTTNKCTVVTTAGGIGNILFQMCGVISLRGDLFKEGRLKFMGQTEAHHNTLLKYIDDRFVARKSDVVIAANAQGYWQSRRWIPSFDTLVSLLKDKEFSRASEETLSKYDMVVHVRGGDFMTSQAHRQCRIAPKKVEDAVAIAGVKADRVCVVTDDIRVSKAYLGDAYSIVTSDEPDRDIRAFHTMCKAKNLLIFPGSTFSWWAALLGRQFHEKVFFPANGWPHDGAFGMVDMTSAHTSEDMRYRDWILI